MDLDDELKELFVSDRLDVPVRANAEEIIVAGARRLRRRRLAAATASGVLGVVVVVVAGVILAGGNPDAMPPATKTTTPRPAASSPSISSLPSPTSAAAPPLGTTTTTPPPPPPKTKTKTTTAGPPNLNYEVVGPTGLRSLTLGQTLEEAQASGLVGNKTDTNSSCAVYDLISDDRIAGVVYFTTTLQAIFANPVQTPEGVGAGWTVEQVKTVYPELDEETVAATNYGQVSVPGNPSADYRLRFADGKVIQVYLELAGQTCF
jgi:hypothetical protein